ncbi:hypothetical protein [Bacillus sp. 1NLA3E]|uniref:hypothetical protein n=1 Tax=Bacillus sp. 1NLA3E TaxID=666686 RepID=UPI000247F1D1|nr:hypothetical protein [Bacillus sp. 1NLA3E]AGK55327.1 hypothetical protein B1NLA3E_17915 [Bacillus sp. 1NLA3E]
MGSFNFNVNSEEKIFDVKVEGSFSEGDAVSFINQYNKHTASFNPTEYIIDLDCTDLKVSDNDVLPMLEQCYKMYKESGFSKVIFKIKQNTILKMQLGRIARSTGLSNYEIIEV